MTFAFVKCTIESPSVCAFSTCTTFTVLPFKWNVVRVGKVTTGRAAAGAGGSRRLSAAKNCSRAHAREHVVVRDDDGAGFAERLVAAGMVEVPVRVDHVLDVAAAGRAHGRENLGVQRRELRVDEHGAVGARRQRDVAAFADQHEEAGASCCVWI